MTDRNQATAPHATSGSTSIRPTVLILGGFLTVPPLYGPLARRLKERGAAGVVVANVWTPDWLLASARGLGPICTRSGRALRDAIQLSARVSEGAPVLLIGHSAGGITGRLLTAPEPFPGRRFGGPRWIGAIVTLGTPHRFSAEGVGHLIHDVGVSIADAQVPGAFHAPQIGYLSVGSRAIRADAQGGARERAAELLYRMVVGAAAPGTEGDGLVPAEAARLDGARHVVLDGAVHGPTSGPWYGSDDALDIWWPMALDIWRSAVDCRAVAAKAGARRKTAG